MRYNGRNVEISGLCISVFDVASSAMFKTAVTDWHELEKISLSGSVL